MNEEEKKAIDELSKKAVICNYEERDYPSMICFKKDMLIALNLIEKLQKENEELKIKNNAIKRESEAYAEYMIRLDIEKQDYFEKYRYNLQQNESLTKEFSNVIPVQKVKDKIEELNSRIEIYKKYVKQRVDTDVEWVDNFADRKTVKVLQELIEERGEN